MTTGMIPLVLAQDAPRWRLLEWVSRTHVLLVHFPVALLAAAALAEGLALVRKEAAPSPTVHFCLLLGAAGAVVAAALGWPHAALGGFADVPSRTLQLHRWLGTAAAAWAVAIALLSIRESSRGLRSGGFRVMLFAGAALVGAAAHFGGLLTHGDEFFRW